MRNFVREKREALHLSQVKLSMMCGVSNGMISEVELGKREAWPRLRKALAKALVCIEEDIFPKEVTNDR
jgi:transcriptional regulator with XRE-family HTH domain